MSSPTPAPTSPILDYAPVPPPSVRLGSLALGATIIAVAEALAFFINTLALFLVHFRTSVAFGIIELFASFIFYTAILGSIAILARVLPPRPATPRHWPVFTCFALAAILWLLGIASAVLYVVNASRGILWLHPNWYLAVASASCLSILLFQALMVAAGMFLVEAGTRLQRRTLALVAALAQLPSALLGVYSIVCRILDLPNFLALKAPVPAVWHLPDWVAPASQAWQSLLWSSIALAALILALSRPPQRIKNNNI